MSSSPPPNDSDELTASVRVACWYASTSPKGSSGSGMNAGEATFHQGHAPPTRYPPVIRREMRRSMSRKSSRHTKEPDSSVDSRMTRDIPLNVPRIMMVNGTSSLHRTAASSVPSHRAWTGIPARVTRAPSPGKATIRRTLLRCIVSQTEPISRFLHDTYSICAGLTQTGSCKSSGLT